MFQTSKKTSAVESNDGTYLTQFVVLCELGQGWGHFGSSFLLTSINGKSRETKNSTTIENQSEKFQMPTWKIAESEEKKPAKMIKRLYAKLVSVVKGSDMMQISNKIINGDVHQSVEVFSLAILVFAEVIKNEDVNEQFVMQLIKLVLCSTKRFTIRKLKEPKDIADNENNKPKKEKNDDDPHRSIMYATESGSISSFVLKSGKYYS